LKATGDIENASVKATRYAWLDTRADGNGGSVINTIVTGKGTGTSNGIVVYADQDVKGLIATADTASISVQTTNGSIEGSTLIAENIAVLKAGTNILDNSITATGTDATMIVAGTNADLALIDGNVITVGGPLTLNGSDRAYVTDNTIGAVGNLTVRNVLGSSANTYTTNGNFSFNSADANTVNDLITATGAATIDANIVSGLKLDSGDIATINAALIENSAIKANDDAAVTSNSNIFNTVVKAAGAATITATEGRINALDVSANEATITAGGKISASNVDVAKSVVLTAGGELDGNTVTADGVGLAEVTDLAIDATGTWIVGGEYIAEYGSIKMTATTGSIVGTVVTAKAEHANVEMNAALGELDDNTVVNIGDIIIAAYGVTSGAYISEQGKIIIATSGEDISGVYAKSKTQSVELYAGYVNDGAGGYVATDVALDVIDSVADAHTFATIMATGNIKNAAAVSATDDATMIAAGNITSGVVNGYAFNVEAANIAGLSASSFGEDIADGKNVIKAATITGATASAIGDVAFDGTVANSDANVQAGDVTFKNGALTDVNAVAATGNIIATENIAWVTGGNFRAAGDVTVDSASSITDLAAEGANVFVTALTYIDGLNAIARGDVLNVTAAQVANSELTALNGEATVVADGVGNTNIAADSVVLGKEGMTLLDVDITADDVTSNDMVLGNIVNGNWTIGNNMDIAANVISGIIADADSATITAAVIEDAQFKTNDGITATVATAIIGSSFTAENGNVLLSGADETASIANSDAIAARGNVVLSNFANVDTIDATAGGKITANTGIGNVIGGTWIATGNIAVESALIAGTLFDGDVVNLKTTGDIENASVKATRYAWLDTRADGNGGSVINTIVTGKGTGTSNGIVVYADQDVKGLIATADTASISVQTTNGSIEGSTLIAENIAVLKAGTNILDNSITATGTDATMIVAGTNADLALIDGNVITVGGPLTLNGSDRAYVTDNTIGAVGNLTVRNVLGSSANTYTTNGNFSFNSADANTVNDLITATGAATIDANIVSGLKLDSGDIATINAALIENSAIKANDDAAVTSNSNIFNTVVKAAGAATITATEGRINALDVSANEATITAGGKISASNVDVAKSVVLTAGGELDGNTVTADGVGLAEVTDLAIDATGTWIVGGEYIAEYGSIKMTATTGSIVGTVVTAKAEHANVEMNAALGELDDNTVVNIGDIIIAAYGVTSGAYISEQGKIIIATSGEDISGVYAKSKTQSVELYAGYVNDGAGGYVATDVALDVIDSVADAHTFATIMATGNIKNAAAVSATDDATMIAAGNITSGVVNGYAFNVEAANIAGLSASSFGEDIADGKNVIKAATITGATASAIGDVAFDGTVANSDANVQAGDVTFKNGALTDVNAVAATGNIIATENIAWVTGGNFRAAGDVTVDSASSITDLAAEGANVFVTALTYIDGLNAIARGDVLNVTAAQVANSELTALNGEATVVADGVGNTNIAADSVVLGKEGMTLLDVDITADDVTSNDMVLGNIVNGNWTIGNNMDIAANVISGIIADADSATITAAVIEDAQFKTNDGITATVATAIIGSSFTAENGNVLLSGADETASIANSDAIAARGNVVLSNFANVDTIDATAGGKITANTGIGNVIGGTWIATGNIAVESALIAGTLFDGDVVNLKTTGDIENASVKATRYAWLDTRADGNGGSVLNTVVTAKGIGRTNGVIVYADQDVKGLTATADTASLFVQTTNGSIEGSTLIAENIAKLSAGSNILDNSITATGNAATTIVAGTNADIEQALIDGNVVTVGGALVLDGSGKTFVSDNTIGAVGNLTVRNVLGSSANTYTTNGNFVFNSADANTVNDTVTATGNATITAGIASELSVDAGGYAFVTARRLELSDIKANDNVRITADEVAGNDILSETGLVSITAAANVATNAITAAGNVTVNAGEQIVGNTITTAGAATLAADNITNNNVSATGNLSATATTSVVGGTYTTAAAARVTGAYVGSVTIAATGNATITSGTTVENTVVRGAIVNVTAEDNIENLDAKATRYAWIQSNTGSVIGADVVANGIGSTNGVVVKAMLDVIDLSATATTAGVNVLAETGNITGSDVNAKTTAVLTAGNEIDGTDVTAGTDITVAAKKLAADSFVSEAGMITITGVEDIVNSTIWAKDKKAGIVEVTATNEIDGTTIVAGADLTVNAGYLVASDLISETGDIAATAGTLISDGSMTAKVGSITANAAQVAGTGFSAGKDVTVAAVAIAGTEILAGGIVILDGINRAMGIITNNSVSNFGDVIIKNAEWADNNTVTTAGNITVSSVQILAGGEYVASKAINLGTEDDKLIHIVDASFTGDSLAAFANLDLTGNTVRVDSAANVTAGNAIANNNILVTAGDATLTAAELFGANTITVNGTLTLNGAAPIVGNTIETIGDITITEAAYTANNNIATAGAFSIDIAGNMTNDLVTAAGAATVKANFVSGLQLDADSADITAAANVENASIKANDDATITAVNVIGSSVIAANGDATITATANVDNVDISGAEVQVAAENILTSKIVASGNALLVAANKIDGVIATAASFIDATPGNDFTIENFLLDTVDGVENQTVAGSGDATGNAGITAVRIDNSQFTSAGDIDAKATDAVAATSFIGKDIKVHAANDVAGVDIASFGNVVLTAKENNITGTQVTATQWIDVRAGNEIDNSGFTAAAKDGAWNPASETKANGKQDAITVLAKYVAESGFIAEDGNITAGTETEDDENILHAVGNTFWAKKGIVEIDVEGELDSNNIVGHDGIDIEAGYIVGVTLVAENGLLQVSASEALADSNIINKNGDILVYNTDAIINTNITALDVPADEEAAGGFEAYMGGDVFINGDGETTIIDSAIHGADDVQIIASAIDNTNIRAENVYEGAADTDTIAGMTDIDGITITASAIDASTLDADKVTIDALDEIVNIGRDGEVVVNGAEEITIGDADRINIISNNDNDVLMTISEADTTAGVIDIAQNGEGNLDLDIVAKLATLNLEADKDADVDGNIAEINAIVGGNLDITDEDDIVLGEIFANGAIVAENATGDITVEDVKSDKSVAITATEGSIVDGNADNENANITAPEVVLMAGTSIGIEDDSLDTATRKLTAEAVEGSINIDNASDRKTEVAGLKAKEDIAFTQHGNGDAVITGDVVAENGDVELDSTDGANIRQLSNSGVIEATNGNVTIITDNGGDVVVDEVIAKDIVSIDADGAVLRSDTLDEDGNKDLSDIAAARVFIKATDGIGEISFDEEGNVATDQFINISGAGRIELDTTGDNADIGVEIRNGGYVRYEARTEGNDSDIYTNVSDTYALYLDDVVAKDGDVVVGAPRTHVFANHVRALDDGMVNELENDAHSVILTAYSLKVADEGIKADYNGVVTTVKDVNLGERTIEVGNDVNIHAGGDILSDGGPDQVNIISGSDINLKVGGVIGNVPGNRPVTVDAGGKLHVDSDGSDNNGRGPGFIWVYMNGTTGDGAIHYDGKPNSEPGIIYWNGRVWGGNSEPVNQVSRAEGEFFSNLRNILDGYNGKWWATNTFQYFPHVRMMMDLKPQDMSIEHILNGRGTIENLPEGVGPEVIDINSLDDTFSWYQGDEWNW
jgi:hypothetical protein